MQRSMSKSTKQKRYGHFITVMEIYARRGATAEHGKIRGFEISRFDPNPSDVRKPEGLFRSISILNWRVILKLATGRLRRDLLRTALSRTVEKSEYRRIRRGLSQNRRI